MTIGKNTTTQRAASAVALSVGLAIGLAFSVSPAAHADDPDDAFALALKRLDIRAQC